MKTNDSFMMIDKVINEGRLSLLEDECFRDVEPLCFPYHMYEWNSIFKSGFNFGHAFSVVNCSLFVTLFLWS